MPCTYCKSEYVIYSQTTDANRLAIRDQSLRTTSNFSGYSGQCHCPPDQPDICQQYPIQATLPKIEQWAASVQGEIAGVDRIRNSV